MASTVLAAGASAPAASHKDEPRVPTDLPTFYADQIVDVVYGISTSKLVFGMETGSDVRPTHVVVVPTVALINCALTVISNISNPAMIEETAGRFTGILNVMRSAQQTAPTARRVVNLNEKHEIEALTKALGTTPAQMKTAIAKVGTSVESIVKYFGDRKKPA